MGKDGGPLTPKAIANRIKSKGLLKLKFYCQICNKQCRDENGFKCHINSENHQRQLLIVAESPDKYVEDFTENFLNDFIKLLSRCYGTKRVLANQVYQQYIQDKEHLHMNATIWTTLSEFVMYLGKEGICEVDETPRGWYIAWIDRSPETLAREEALKRKEMADLADQKLQQKLIDEQIEKAIATSSNKPDTSYTGLQRNDAADEKVKFTFKAPLLKKPDIPKSESVATATTGKNEDDVSLVMAASDSSKASSSSSSSESLQHQKEQVAGSKRKISALEEVLQMEESRREKMGRKDYWLVPDILVRIIHEKLADGKYFRKKGIVLRVIDRYVGEIKIADPNDKSVDGDIIRIDQQFCETVIPSVPNKIRIVNGGYRGELASLVLRNNDTYVVSVRIMHGVHANKLVEKLPFEDVCSVA